MDLYFGLIDPLIKQNHEEHLQALFPLLEYRVVQLHLSVAYVEIELIQCLALVSLMDLQICLEDAIVKSQLGVACFQCVLGSQLQADDLPRLGSFSGLLDQ